MHCKHTLQQSVSTFSFVVTTVTEQPFKSLKEYSEIRGSTFKKKKKNYFGSAKSDLNTHQATPPCL